jgi:spore germination cell wall hydrolase CwlJ-like protein
VTPAYRDTFDVEEPRGRIADKLPIIFGGALLLAAFSFAGHYMGQNADAHNVAEASIVPLDLTPSTSIGTKSSLLPEGALQDLAPAPMLRQQEVEATGKADYIEDSDPTAPAEVRPPSEQTLLAMTPPVWKIERTFKLKRAERQRVVAQRRVRVAEENCLARAIYFEARSESELGQLAVAKVILNRVKAPDYPKTICGVVYQGSDRRNSCQFSFACDGMPDEIRSKAAWDRSKKIAEKALAGDQTVRIMGAATNYHADYVKPKWSRNMKRLIKIGRHIFYSDT